MNVIQKLIVVDFSDVVKAYKGVLTEKEALESSLHALNGLSRSASSTPSRYVTTKPIDKSLSDGEQELSDGQQESEKVEVDAGMCVYGSIIIHVYIYSTVNIVVSYFCKNRKARTHLLMHILHVLYNMLFVKHVSTCTLV